MQLGITSLQRNRGPWIKEWIVFHYLVGFRKFYIFNHICTDNTEKILKELKKKFDIKVIPLGEIDRPQLKAHQYSCENFLQDVDWMAFIDCDEFLFPTQTDSIETALDEFSDKKLSAIGIYWSCFGSSGYMSEPEGLIIENYKRRAPDNFINNRHVKSIVKGKQNGTIQVGTNAHLFKTPYGTYDENLRPITFGFTDYEPTYNKFRINHYLCQSRSYFKNFKQNSGGVDVDRAYVRSEAWWQEHDRNDVLDNSMDRFIEPLKNILSSI